MTRYAERYPGLYQFLGAYFRPGWSRERQLGGGSSFENVVHHFMTKNPTTTVQQATRELEDFLMRNDLSEEELEDIVGYDLGANVHAPGMGLTYRQWLEAVLAILKQSPQRSPN